MRPDNNETAFEENTVKKSKFKKTALSVTAIAAASALAAALVIPAGAQETPEIALTYNQTTEDPSPSFVLTDVSDVVKAALPSVVSITSRSLYNDYNNMSGYGYNPNDIFEYFFGSDGSYGGNSSGRRGNEQEVPENEETPDEVPQDEEKITDDHSNEVDSGLGSGTIIAINDSEVLILTSYHVVENCSSLYVTFNNDTNIDGYIKSAITEKDLAVVGVATKDIDEETLASIKAIPIAKETPEVGDGIIIVGNALGYGISVTTGIVSALDREITVDGKTLTVIQTDAAINSGNSGGCMLNSNGEIVGISEAKVTANYVEGMCYAIPVVSNIEYIEKLANNEGTYETDIVTDNGGFLGIQGKDVTEEAAAFGMPNGIYVVETVEGGGAKASGIKAGDIITAIDGTELTNMTDLSNKVISHFPGEKVVITVQRASEGEYIAQDIEVTLTERIS